MSAPPGAEFLDIESENEFPPRTTPMQIHGSVEKDAASRRKSGKARSRKGKRGHGSSGKKLALLSGKTE